MDEFDMMPAAESGTFERADEEALLDLIEEVSRELGWDTEFVEFGPEQHPMLRIYLPELGKIQSTAAAELVFVRTAQEIETFVLGQFAVTVFDDIPEENSNEVIRACVQCNLNTLAGSFGYVQGILYFRQNLLLRPEYPFAVCGKMLLDALVNAKETIDVNIDTFAMIGRGMLTVEDALAAGRLS